MDFWQDPTGFLARICERLRRGEFWARLLAGTTAEGNRRRMTSAVAVGNGRHGERRLG